MSIAWTLARLCGPLPTLHSRFLLGGKPKRTRQSNTIEVLTPYAVSINVIVGFRGPLCLRQMRCVSKRYRRPAWSKVDKLHLEGGACMASIETHNMEPSAAQLMNQPRRHRTCLDAETRISTSPTAHARLNLLWRRAALVSPQPLPLRIDGAEGLVGAEGFAVDASLIRADVHRQRSVPGEEGLPPEAAGRAVSEYLEVLDDAAFGGSTPVRPKRINLTDPAARWTAATREAALYSYSTNYLIDLDHAVIVDVEATTSVR
jgi:hypothetical protein